ncbi:MAG: DUF362 domain-containing protein [Angelakisella sp.]
MGVTDAHISVIYGGDPYDMTMTLLRSLNVAAVIPKTALVAIKPNLVVPKLPDEGATTHVRIAAAVIDYLRSRGFERLFLAEGSWVGDSTMEAAELCGYSRLSKATDVPFYDLKQDGFTTKTVGGISVDVSKRILEADYIINLPVLKGHCQTAVTCALKNMKGCISDRSKREFHSMGLHRPIAALNTLLPPQLVIVDGLCGDLDFEEGGNPVYAGRMFAGWDPVQIDSYGASLLGYSVAEVPYIGMAEELGVGSSCLAEDTIVELNCCAVGGDTASTRKLRALGKHLVEKDACSACYAAAVHALARMDEQGLLDTLGEKLYIGQGYKGKALDNAGIGNCCRGFSCWVPGCPPTASDILLRLGSTVK